MARLGELVDNLGGVVVELIAAPRGLDVELGRVVVHDPLEHTEVGAGDVVLAVGVGSVHECARLLHAIAAQGAAALITKGDSTTVPLDVAERGGIAVLAVPAGMPWAQVVLLISSMLAADRFRAGEERPGASSPGDLFAVANAIAETLGAPITIEDQQSIVLAFSGRQDEADPARIATVLGRRVPESYRRLLNDRGIFKRLYTENGPVYCEQLGDDVLPRVAIAVRAGDEVLGSIWAAVQGPLDAERERLLIDAAGFVSLHLLRHQVAADAQRGLEADLMAAVLTGSTLATEASSRLDLTGDAYRVVAVGLGDSERADRVIQLARCRNVLDLQLSALHRGAPTAHIGGVVYAIVPSIAGGSSAPLRQLMEQYVSRASALVKARVLVGIGPLVRSVAEVPSSRGSADKVLRVLKAEPGLSVAEMDEVRASALLMDFAAAYADDPALNGGPVRALQVHDQEHHTSYTETLSAFLDAFGDVDAAAAILNVHANTVRYRLRQLRKISDLRLEDPSQRLALMLLLRMLKAAG